MRMLDLFSGIGGFALAAKWVWEDELDIVGFCEIDKYAQKVLKKNFPGVPIYEDITKLNGKSFKNIDLLTGGFPCQDISIAGKGAGLEEGKRSSLWFEMHRIIREVRPRYALIENVPMLTIRGGTRVIADLAEIGYDAEWQIVGADDVGAWHRRKRIWIVAYLPDTARKTDGQHPRNMGQPDAETYSTRQAAFRNSISSRSPKTRADVPDTESQRYGRRDSEECGIEGREFLTGKQGRSKMGSKAEGCSESFANVPDTAKPRLEGSEPERKLSRGQERLSPKRSSEWWDIEPNVGRVAHGIPSRVDRLKGLGNAIVPQVAALIMERIKNA